MTAHRAVKEGNRLLRDGKPVTALQAYGHAAELEPEAREIVFGEGLAHYRLQEFDKARESFEKAAGVEGDALADDALYSLGTCDHAEAFENLSNPQLAMSQLESAMRRYHDVLARRADHKAARDANLKAASMWRELKQQIEQQQQQSCDKNQRQDEKEKQEQEQEQEQKQQEQQNENEEQQQEQQAQPQDQNEQQEEQQQSQMPDQQPADEEQQQQQMQPQAEKEEQVSREQAERQLREMMQAHRDRKKLRRELVQKVPVTPVNKDW